MQIIVSAEQINFGRSKIGFSEEMVDKGRTIQKEHHHGGAGRRSLAA